MSKLTETDMRFFALLVEHPRGPGFVLDFSDRTFSQFFADELQIDIDDSRWETDGRSKGKRLRYFLKTASDNDALRALRALWSYRKAMLQSRGEKDPVQGSREHIVRIAKKLGWQEPLDRNVRTTTSSKESQLSAKKRTELLQRLLALTELQPHPRGFAFERFLYDLFKDTGLDPRASFRNTGEQIDGSFVLSGDVYLLEAKWTGLPTSIADLHNFEGKVGTKAEWARGLFISYSGFSEGAFSAFGTGKRIVCMDGTDIHDALQQNIPLDQALIQKARRAVETGRVMVPLRELGLPRK